MEVFNAVRTMLAVRDYQDRPVAGEIIQKIVEAGRLTASSTNRQDWDFIVVSEEDRLRRIGELSSNGPYIAGAALAIAVLVGNYGSAPADGGRAIQDMMLTAWGEGIGSNWVGRVNTDEIRSYLNVPDDRVILSIVPFGYPSRQLGKGIKDRKPLGDIAHLNQYGQAFNLSGLSE